MKHGHSRNGRTPTYNSWRKMMERCYNRNQIGYNNFGGKGIRVEGDWHDFNIFLEDMGERHENTFLDRIDTDSDYGPDNCRWSTRAIQAHNHARRRALEKNSNVDWEDELFGSLHPVCA